MPKYAYTARTDSGETLTDTAETSSLPALVAKLAARGATIQTARKAGPDVPRIKGIPFFEITALYRQLASSIEAGLPLAESLQMLSSESRNARLKSLLYYLRTEVSEGTPLSDAMAQFPDVFPPVHIAAVTAGEHSGRLEQSLADLAEQSETFSNMNRRFASALVYPTVIAVAALALFAFGLLSTIPNFRMLFGDLGIREYSAVTSFVFFVARFVFPIVVLLALGVMITGTLILSQRRAASGRMWLDSWKLRIPVVGQIVEKASLARFSGTLGILLDSGVDLPRAVRLASEGAGNRTVEYMLKNVSAQIESGETLSEAIASSGAMPSTLAWRVGVGEETGTLPDSLLRLSRLYASQVDSLVTSLAGILEPVLIIVIGSGVALLVLGMFLPLISVIQGLTGGY